MKILYFAWVRERIGLGEEMITPPETVATIADLLDWLATRGENYAYAFENRAIIRAALNKVLHPQSASIANAAEIAFFPPMTGG